MQHASSPARNAYISANERYQKLARRAGNLTDADPNVVLRVVVAQIDMENAGEQWRHEQQDTGSGEIPRPTPDRGSARFSRPHGPVDE